MSLQQAGPPNDGGSSTLRSLRLVAAICALQTMGLAGCASTIPGAGYPKQPSVAYTPADMTSGGMLYAADSPAHAHQSAFRMLSVGADGFAARMQLTRLAQHSLDLQYFIFTADSSGLLTQAVLAAADRGVRVRLLVDDGASNAGDEQIEILAAHPKIEVRWFNPFRYRGHIKILRAIDFALESHRVDYRMHNKLFVVDNALALVGGRNIGDAYFQVSADAQFADDDIFAGGPVVPQLSATFDDYWNSALAIPAQALSGGKDSTAKLARHRAHLDALWRTAETAGVDYLKRADEGNPIAGIRSGTLPLAWSDAQVVCDSPDKKDIINGFAQGRLMYAAISKAISQVQSEFLMITPYLIPTRQEMKLLHDLRSRQVRVRILTNSLNSTNELSAHSGYMRYRRQLLAEGIELYEVRAQLGPTSHGSGQPQTMKNYDTYGLHGKLFVFDRRSIYAGSMNFDQRSRLLNTETGLIIESEDLAQQTASRFENMTQPQSAYAVALRPGSQTQLVWRTLEHDRPVEYTHEPFNSVFRRLGVSLLSMLPIDREL